MQPIIMDVSDICDVQTQIKGTETKALGNWLIGYVYKPSLHQLNIPQHQKNIYRIFGKWSISRDFSEN